MASADTTTVRSANAHSQPLTGIPVDNPATGEVIAHVPDLGAEAVADLARRGRAAQPGWLALGFDGRSRVLLRMQKWCVDNADRIVDTIISETGKTHEDAQLSEVSYAGGAFGFWAKEAAGYLGNEKVKTSSVFVKGKKLVVRYQPLGLIGVIGPWNYPLNNSFGDCIPALAAGNAVILKPSECTPLTSLLMAEGLRECGLPEDVFQVATGRGETGAALVDQVDMVMFTGSTATGKRIAERAARTLTPVSLELGGKDPMIVLRDAELERAANAAVYYSMQNSGQTCISGALLRRGARPRCVRGQGHREGTRHPPGRPVGGSGQRRGGRDDLRAPGGPRRGPCRRRAAQGRTDPDRRASRRRARPVLRAHRARGRRPLDDLHDRGDLRTHAADHEGE